MYNICKLLVKKKKKKKFFFCIYAANASDARARVLCPPMPIYGIDV